MPEELLRTVADTTASGMNVGTLIGIIAALVTVIQILGRLVEATISRRTNPLNGTLTKLDTTVSGLDRTLTRIETRTEDADSVLADHTKQLVELCVGVTNLAANESKRTEAIAEMSQNFSIALTGTAARLSESCEQRTGKILDAVRRGG